MNKLRSSRTKGCLCNVQTYGSGHSWGILMRLGARREAEANVGQLREWYAGQDWPLHPAKLPVLFLMTGTQLWGSSLVEFLLRCEMLLFLPQHLIAPLILAQTRKAGCGCIPQLYRSSCHLVLAKGKWMWSDRSFDWQKTEPINKKYKCGSR